MNLNLVLRWFTCSKLLTPQLYRVWRDLIKKFALIWIYKYIKIFRNPVFKSRLHYLFKRYSRNLDVCSQLSKWIWVQNITKRQSNSHNSITNNAREINTIRDSKKKSFDIVSPRVKNHFFRLNYAFKEIEINSKFWKR